MRRGRSASPGESLGPSVETSKGRKKFSFKEPEIMGFLGFRRMSLMRRPSQQHLRSKSLQPPARQTDRPAGQPRELDELESQAMRVVRTVGQAFEVCHKLSLNNPTGEETRAADKDRPSEDDERRPVDENYGDRDEFGSLQPQPSPSSVHKDISLLGEPEDSILDQPCPQVTTTAPTTCPASPLRQSPLGNALSEQLMNGELTALKHEIQLLRERLDQQSQQTRAAVAHARLLQDQLAAETAARVEAQTRTHQLLVQNKELLEHIAALVSHLREHERSSVSVSVGGTMPGLSGQLGQVTGSQGSTVADIAALGQYNAWQVHTGHYSPLDSLVENATRSDLADELRYQSQLWDNLRCEYSSAATTPRGYEPSFSLPPTGRPRTIPSAARAAAAVRSRSLERPSTKPSEPSFIKPLPCRCGQHSPQRESERKPLPLSNNLHELMRPLVLEPSSRGRSRGVQTDVILPVSWPAGDSMPKIDESADEEEAHPPQRRNSQ